MADNSNVSNVMHLEILQKQNSLLSEDAIVTSVEKWLSSQDPNLLEDIITKFDDAKLSEHVLSINIERNCDNPALRCCFHINVEKEKNEIKFTENTTKNIRKKILKQNGYFSTKKKPSTETRSSNLTDMESENIKESLLSDNEVIFISTDFDHTYFQKC